MVVTVWYYISIFVKILGAKQEVRSKVHYMYFLSKFKIKEISPRVYIVKYQYT